MTRSESPGNIVGLSGRTGGFDLFSIEHSTPKDIPFRAKGGSDPLDTIGNTVSVVCTI